MTKQECPQPLEKASKRWGHSCFVILRFRADVNKMADMRDKVRDKRRLQCVCFLWLLVKKDAKRIV